MTKELIASTIYYIISLLAKDTSFNYQSSPIGDSEYVIGLSRRQLEVNLWANKGSTALFDKEGFDFFKSDITPLVDEIFEAIHDKENGIIRCSDCGRKISADEVAGHYFAGSYCKHCWDTKWKAIEASETYD